MLLPLSSGTIRFFLGRTAHDVGLDYVEEITPQEGVVDTRPISSIGWLTPAEPSGSRGPACLLTCRFVPFIMRNCFLHRKSQRDAIPRRYTDLVAVSRYGRPVNSPHVQPHDERVPP